MQDIKIKDQIPHCSKHVLPLVVGGLTITCEDNMQLMSRYPDNYFDLAIVDPPYGIGDKFKGGKTGKMNFNEIVNKDWDKVPSDEYFAELQRVSKNQIIWGGNYFNLPPTRCFIVWDKIISEDFSLAMAELAWTSFDKLAKIYKLQVPKNGKIHPTQKPIQLYKWLLKKYAEEGFKIIDTHLGSGSHAIAIEEMNRFEKMNLTLTACEIDEEYFTDTKQRIINHVAQQSLF
jgi:site-specific DNA-methyltransferase (adenine-specific)